MAGNREKIKTLFSDTLIFTIGNLGSKLIMFFLMPLYTSYMTQDEYGTANLIFSIVQLLSPVLSLAIADAVIRFGFSEEKRKPDVLMAALLVVVADFGLIFIITPLLQRYTAINDYVSYLNAYLLIGIINSIVMSYLKAKRMNRCYACISIGQACALALLNILLIAWVKCGVTGYLLSNVVALLISSVAAIVLGRILEDLKEATWNSDLFRKMIRYSVPMMFNTVSWWLVSSADKVMVEFALGEAALGIYAVASKIPALINVFIAIFQQAWGLAAIREVEGTNDVGFYGYVFDLYSMVVFTVTFVCVMVVNGFMTFYVGEGFFEAAQYVPLLLVGALFSAVSTYFGSIYTAMKKTKDVMITTFIAGGTNVVINLVLIPDMGIMGAVVGTVVAYFLAAHIRMLNVFGKMKIHCNVFNYGINCIILLTYATHKTFAHGSAVIDSVYALLFVCVNLRMFVKLHKYMDTKGRD